MNTAWATLTSTDQTSDFSTGSLLPLQPRFYRHLDAAPAMRFARANRRFKLLIQPCLGFESEALSRPETLDIRVGLKHAAQIPAGNTTAS